MKSFSSVVHEGSDSKLHDKISRDPLIFRIHTVRAELLQEVVRQQVDLLEISI